jgi:cytochrome o ubiquinol oxidase subunit IV
MSNQQSIAIHHDESKLKLSRYIAGFVLSVMFTLAAYLLVTHHAADRNALVGLVIAFALAQFFTQLMLFLHLGEETNPRWKLVVFVFMTGVVAILIGGSLWIMTSLNNRETLPQELQYMNNQDEL